MSARAGHAAPTAPALGNVTAWGTAGRLTWLVEGFARPVTPADPPHREPGEYARALAHRFARTAGRDDLSLQALTRHAIHDAPQFRLDPDDPGPAAAVALARTGGEMTEWLVLGPVTVLLPPPAAGEEAIAKCDGRVEDVHPRLRARFRKARSGPAVQAGRGTSKRAARLLAKLEAAEAADRNVPGGHWLAAGVADAGLEALKGRYQTPGPVCLASSGAMAEPDDWFAWTAVGADLDTAARPLASASGDEATIVVAS